jgi:DNA-binding Xre family transcriptional regulator
MSIDANAATRRDLDEGMDIDVGARLRTWRQRRRLTLREVAEAAGLSESFLSQVERGRTNISVRSLKRVAAALDCTIGDLFGDGYHLPRILRGDARPRVDVGSLGTKFMLTSAPPVDVDAAIVEIPALGSTGDELRSHGNSEELLLVLEGTIVVLIDSTNYVLEKGDSVQFMSSMPHRVLNSSPETARVLWMASPPSTPPLSSYRGATAPTRP